MEQNYKLLIGAGIGASVGYFVGAVIVEVMRQREELTDGVAEVDFTKISEFVQTIEKKDETLKPMAKTPSKPKKNYADYFQNAERPDLAELQKKYNIKFAPEVETIDGMVHDTMWKEEVSDNDLTDEDTEENIDAWVEDIAEADDSVDPRVISMEEYAGDNEFAHVTLYYFEDDIVTNQSLQPINRPEKFLGEDALVSFGTMSGDEDIVYVRNLEKKAMYEIVRQNKTFSTSPVKRAIAKRAASKEDDYGDENS